MAVTRLANYLPPLSKLQSDRNYYLTSCNTRLWRLDIIIARHPSYTPDGCNTRHPLLIIIMDASLPSPSDPAHLHPTHRHAPLTPLPAPLHRHPSTTPSPPPPIPSTAHPLGSTPSPPLHPPPLNPPPIHPLPSTPPPLHPPSTPPPPPPPPPPLLSHPPSSPQPVSLPGYQIPPAVVTCRLSTNPPTHTLTLLWSLQPVWWSYYHMLLLGI